MPLAIKFFISSEDLMPDSDIKILSPSKFFLKEIQLLISTSKVLRFLLFTPIIESLITIALSSSS